MPCAQPHSLPQDPAGVHPPPMLLSVTAQGPPNTALLYLWRSTSTVDGHARMDAPVPLLRAADLRYPQPTKPTTFQLAIVPHTLRHDQTHLVFWDGHWLYTATLKRHDNGAAHLSIQPMVLQSLSLLTHLQDAPPTAVHLIPLDVDADGRPEVAVIRTDTGSITLFAEAGPHNGCGAGALGTCVEPRPDWAPGDCAPSEPCTWKPTSLRVGDLAACTDGVAVPDGPPCVPCGFDPQVECTPPCTIDNCRHCLDGRCLVCDKDFLLAEDARSCVRACPDPDATVAGGRCLPPDAPFTPWAGVHGHPSWKDFQPAGLAHARLARVTYKDQESLWPVAMATPSLIGHFGPDTDTLVVVPVAGTATDGRPTDIRHISSHAAQQDYLRLDDAAILGGALAQGHDMGLAQAPSTDPSDFAPVTSLRQLLQPISPVHLAGLQRDAGPHRPAPHPDADVGAATQLGMVASAAVTLAQISSNLDRVAPHMVGTMVAPADLGTPLPVKAALTMTLYANDLHKNTPRPSGQPVTMQDMPLPYPARELAFAPGPLHGQAHTELHALRRTTTDEHLLILPLQLAGYQGLSSDVHFLMLTLPSVTPRLSAPRRAHHPGETTTLALPAATALYPALADTPGDRPAVLFVNTSWKKPEFLLLQPPGDDVPLHQALTYRQGYSTEQMVALVRADGQPAGIVIQPYDCLKRQSIRDFEIATGRKTFVAPAGLTAPAFMADNHSGRQDSGCRLTVVEHQPVPPTAEVAVMDANADGQDDLVLLDRATGRVVFYLADAPAASRWAALPLASFRRVVAHAGSQTAASPPTTVHLTDFNNDGLLDVVLMDSTPEGAPRLRVLAHPDTTAPQCPAGATFRPADWACVCPDPASRYDLDAGQCACVPHAVATGVEGACACPAGLVLVPDTECACPAGSLPVFDEATGAEAAPRACATCHASCATCSGRTPGTCGSCPTGRLLSPDGGGATCVETCPAGSNPTSDGRACVACAPGCDACNTDTGKCTACTPGLHLQDGRCQACHETCAACTGPGPDACVACAPGRLRHPTTD
ncbi:hypothetical protein H696_06303, partial [Fonticula alba]